MGRMGIGKGAVIESQPLHGPLGLSVLYTERAECSVFMEKVGGVEPDSTNNVKPPPMALEPPRAVWRVVLNA